ncbi:MAG: hypothetical protein CBD77_04150 [bacterium TMED217]|nr:MAG: hypothetical protein CBD77_04150 [bacterium TMED217]|tara:strand:+ start:36440 stop:36661 length:222 start_codon:yes stop_codon:yes gene_type:complete
MFTRLLILLSIFIIQPIFACGTCFGDPNSSAVNGMNWAIISLLTTTGGVLSGISFSIFTIAKKSKNQIQSKDL